MNSMATTGSRNDSPDEVHVNLSSGNLSIGTVSLGCSNIATAIQSGFTVRDIPKGEYDLEDEYPNL